MNKKYFYLITFFPFILVSCSPGLTSPTINTSQTPLSTQIPQPGETQITPSATTALRPVISSIEDNLVFDLDQIILTEFEGNPLPDGQSSLVAGSGKCNFCHTDLVDETGNDVSPDHAWSSTLMANAARDPYWQATVRHETNEFPDLSATISDQCATCHMGLAHLTLATKGGKVDILDQGLLNPSNELHSLAMDGVSCTICHQIESTNYNKPDSFSGGYLIDLITPMGNRKAFGPFPFESNNAQVMQTASGFLPVESTHLGKAEMCSTCHVLYTPFVDNQGQVAGQFPEQMTYKEWLNSRYADEKTCIDCHMPAAQGKISVSNLGGQPQAPFSQHNFNGGNTLILQMIALLNKEFEIPASTQNVQATLVDMTQHLSKETATISLANSGIEDGKLTFNVLINNFVGHKFPSGFPSRRAWLYVKVIDANQNTIFESGAFEASGFIKGNDNDQDSDQPGYEPHYQVINEQDQVQIYEAILQDVDSKPTTTLLRASGYAKDNRLLPVGFNTPGDVDIAVFGEALNDNDFMPGSDTVQYCVDLGKTSGPYTISVQLLFQAIGYHWAENVSEYNAAENMLFSELYEQIPNLPLLVSETMITVTP